MGVSAVGAVDQCHYGPTGGGLVNAWGRESRDSSFDFGDPTLWPGHDDADGFGADQVPALELDVGGDGRLLPLIATGDGPTSVVIIPMLLEVGAVFPWFELIPQVMTELQEGPGTQYFGMARIHIMY